MSKNPSRLGWLVLGPAALYLSLFWLVADTPELWGLNHLIYLPSEIGFFLLIAALALPFVLLSFAPRKTARRVVNSLFVNLVAPLALTGTFYLLRVRAHYLGDGLLRAREIEIGLWHLPTEPLAVLINFLSYQVTSSWFGFTAIQAMELVSFISGLLFYFVALALIKYLFKQPRERVFGMLFLLASGTTLLFCGYVETYTLLPAAITLFMLWCLRSVDGSKSALWPALCFPVLALLHFGNLILLPVLLLVAHYKWHGGDKRSGILAVGGVVLAAALAVVIPRLSEYSTLNLTDFLISFVPGGDGYWLLSGQHLLDILNELLLTAGPALVLLPLTLSSLFRKRLWQNRQVALGLVALPGALAFMVLLDSKLGYATDWDLFSSAGFLAMIASLLVISNIKLKLSLPLKAALIGAGLFAFSSFAVVNTDYDKSIQRQVNILSLYGTRAAYGFESLGSHFIRVGDNGRAEQMWRKAAELLPHRRTYNNLGQLLMSIDRLDEAKYYYRKGLELDSTYSYLHFSMGVIFCREGDYLEGEKYLRRAVELDSTVAAFHHNLARCLTEQGRYSEAEPVAHRAVSMKPDNAEHNFVLGNCLAIQMKYEEALPFLQRAQRLNPSQTDVYINLAEVYTRLGNISEAKSILRQYLAANPQGEGQNQIMQTLRELETEN